MSLHAMIQDDRVDIAAIGAYLDDLEPDARRREVFGLGRSGQRGLFQRAAGGEPITFEHFVPAGVGAAEQVCHHGKNTLPLPKPFKYFEKRFARPDDGSNRLFGYNEGASRPLIGPGYFVAIPTQGEAEWEQRGPIVVDYFQVPDDGAKVPERWPRVVPNSHGLQFFVFRHTRDFMRRVSEHVSVGAAYKGEKALDHYFVLVRDPSADN